MQQALTELVCSRDVQGSADVVTGRTSNDGCHMSAMAIAVFPRGISKSRETFRTHATAAWKVNILCWLASCIKLPELLMS